MSLLMTPFPLTREACGLSCQICEQNVTVPFQEQVLMGPVQPFKIQVTGSLEGALLAGLRPPGSSLLSGLYSQHCPVGGSLDSEISLATLKLICLAAGKLSQDKAWF